MPNQVQGTREVPKSSHLVWYSALTVSDELLWFSFPATPVNVHGSTIYFGDPDLIPLYLPRVKKKEGWYIFNNFLMTGI